MNQSVLGMNYIILPPFHLDILICLIHGSRIVSEDAIPRAPACGLTIFFLKFFVIKNFVKPHLDKNLNASSDKILRQCAWEIGLLSNLTPALQFSQEEQNKYSIVFFKKVSKIIIWFRFEFHTKNEIWKLSSSS